MTKHDIIKELVMIQKLLLQVKELSSSGEVDRLVIDALSRVVNLGQSLYPDIIKISKKYVDPTM